MLVARQRGNCLETLRIDGRAEVFRPMKAERRSWTTLWILTCADACSMRSSDRTAPVTSHERSHHQRVHPGAGRIIAARPT
jgi:hypothetical protein